jgi:hypothetical protein
MFLYLLILRHKQFRLLSSLFNSLYSPPKTLAPDFINHNLAPDWGVLGFNGNENEMKSLADFIALGTIFTVDNIIADKTIELRKLYAIKLPDAIIAATALVFNLTLLTRNTKDFKRITGLAVIDPYTL